MGGPFTPLLVLAGIVSVFVVIAFLARSGILARLMQDTVSESVRPQPLYRAKFTVMNKSEQAFFFELRKQLPSQYYVFPNMRIADILNPLNGTGFYKRRNHILPKHVDFLICDAAFKPIMALEVNGLSHTRQDRIERDALVQEIFDHAGLPLKFVKVGTSFSEAITEVVASLKNKA